jgi:hypothetical protein
MNLSHTGFLLGGPSNGIANGKWYRVISAKPDPIFPSQLSKLTGVNNKSTDIPSGNNRIESEVTATGPLKYGDVCAIKTPTDTQLVQYLTDLAAIKIR